MTYTTKALIRHHREDTGRTLDVTSQFEEQFPGVAKHWVMGGEVEYLAAPSIWVCPDVITVQKLINTGKRFRIKQREPKHGEVWTKSGEPYVFGCALNLEGGFISLDGRSATSARHPDEFEYAAPSITAWVAREIWGDTNTREPLEDVANRLNEACQFDD